MATATTRRIRFRPIRSRRKSTEVLIKSGLATRSGANPSAHTISQLSEAMYPAYVAGYQ